MRISSVTDIVLRRTNLLAGALLLSLLAGCAIPLEDIPELDIGPSFSPPDIPAIATPALTPVSPIVIVHGPRDVKRIALTFDACSLKTQSYYDERITKILIELNVPATIFLGGKWMQDHPEQTRTLASLPQFELGNHSFLHPHMTKVSDERVRQELKWTQDTMYSLIGRQATLFRAPYGEINARLVRLVAQAGLTTVQFDLPAGDSNKKATREKLIEYVGTMSKSGSIVVMHINNRGWHTAEALPEIIAKLRARGFEFVTVSRLLSANTETAATPNGVPNDTGARPAMNDTATPAVNPTGAAQPEQSR
jgi:peptidoglycan/xylan/chitin deacetylase (PgdA/CDA1 family)